MTSCLYALRLSDRIVYTNKKGLYDVGTPNRDFSGPKRLTKGHLRRIIN